MDLSTFTAVSDDIFWLDSPTAQRPPRRSAAARQRIVNARIAGDYHPVHPPAMVIAANRNPSTIGEYLMRLSKSGEECSAWLLTVLCQHLDSSTVTKKGAHRCAPLFRGEALGEAIP